MSILFGHWTLRLSLGLCLKRMLSLGSDRGRRVFPGRCRFDSSRSFDIVGSSFVLGRC